MKYKVYSEDWSGFEYEKEFETEEKAVEYAKSDFETETYRRVIATKVDESDVEWPDEEIIWSSEENYKPEEIKETSTESSLHEDLVQVGDVVEIKNLGEESPWEGLTGTVEWIDEEDLGEYTTVTVAVNFPTDEGEKIVRQNFDMRNLFVKEVPVEEETVTVEETPVIEEPVVEEKLNEEVKKDNSLSSYILDKLGYEALDKTIDEIIDMLYDTKYDGAYSRNDVKQALDEIASYEEVLKSNELNESAHLIPILSLSTDTPEEMEEFTDALKAEGIAEKDWELFDDDEDMHWIEIHGDKPTSAFLDKIKNALKRCGIKLEEVLKESKEIPTITEIEEVVLNDYNGIRHSEIGWSGEFRGIEDKKDARLLANFIEDRFPTISCRVEEDKFDDGYVVYCDGAIDEGLEESKETLENIVKDSYDVCCQKETEHEYPSVDDIWEDLENNYYNHEVVNELFKNDTPEGSRDIYKKLEDILTELKVPFYTYDEKDEPICVGC